jgi:hypothetical protein
VSYCTFRRQVLLTLGTGCGRHWDALGVWNDVWVLVCCWGSIPNSNPWGRQSGARDRAGRHGSTSRDQLIINVPALVFLYLFNFYKLLLSSKLFCIYCIVLCGAFSSRVFNSLTTRKKSSVRSMVTIK